jgi:ABC-type dipeptide/oligopeptide/nickel transport system ATPase subunit
MQCRTGDKRFIVLAAALTEDSLEEQFRSEFSEVEYGGGNAAKEQNIELAMEKDEVYKKVQMIVQKTRQSLSQKKNILQ